MPLFFDWTNENGEVSYKETEVNSKRIFYIFMKNINNLIILQKKKSSLKKTPYI